MGIFSFFGKKQDKANESLNTAEGINLFADDLGSTVFFEKVAKLENINKKFQRGMNLLHFACEYNNLELAEKLIARKINIEEKNDYGNTPLWTAVFNCKGKYELVDLLLANGADPESVNHAQNTPLKFAETIGDEALIEKLKRAKKIS